MERLVGVCLDLGLCEQFPVVERCYEEATLIPDQPVSGALPHEHVLPGIQSTGQLFSVLRLKHPF